MTRALLIGALAALGEPLAAGRSLRNEGSRRGRLVDARAVRSEDTRGQARTRGCSLAAKPKGGNHTLLVGNTSRQYRLHVPSKLVAGDPRPLVVVFHGWGSTPFEEQRRGGLDPFADEQTAFVAYLQGLDDVAEQPAQAERFGNYASWNAAGSEGSKDTCSSQRVDYFSGKCPESCIRKKGGCGHCDWQTCADDDAFVDTLLDTLKDELCVDTGRVYAVGDSNGGQMALSLGRQGKVAAVVTLAGLPHCTAGGPVWHPGEQLSGESSRVMVIHGNNDATIPPDVGGAGDHRTQYADSPPRCTVSGDGWFYTPLTTVEEAVSTANGCSDKPQPWQTPWDGTQGLACTRRGRCTADVAVCRWNGGHTWPSAYAPLVWSFLTGNLTKQDPPSMH